MAGSARYTAILDANALYPALVRNLLLSLAHADLYSANRLAARQMPQTAAHLQDVVELI